jgi:hypothetical protein
MRIYEEINALPPAGIGNLLPKKILADLRNRRNEFRIIVKKRRRPTRLRRPAQRLSWKPTGVASRPKFKNTSKASARK